MTTETERRTDISASIQPAIAAAIDWDEYQPDFTCPISGNRLDILPLDPADHDGDAAPRFRLDINTTRGMGCHEADSRDEVLRLIADHVAGNLVAAKKTLLAACVSLGLDTPAT